MSVRLSTLCVLISVLLLGAAAVGGRSAYGHHSVAQNYDRQSSVELSGTIREVDIRNPHSQIFLDVAGEDGEVVTWMVEWSDRNALVRREVEFDRLKVGEEITVTGLQNRRLAHVIYFRQAVLPDGAILTDCGFGALRRSILQGTDYECEVEE